MTPLKILFLTAELAPFAKTGGLADVSAALPAPPHRAGHDVRVVLPAVRPHRRHASSTLEPVAELQDIAFDSGPHRVTSR